MFEDLHSALLTEAANAVNKLKQTNPKTHWYCRGSHLDGETDLCAPS